MFLERSPNSALRKVLGFSFRGISWEEDPGKFSWVVSSQENPVSGVALKAGSSQLEGARGTAENGGLFNIKPVGAQTVRRGEARALGSAAPGRRDGKHVHWECDVEVGVGKADVHWPHACLGTESG